MISLSQPIGWSLATEKENLPDQTCLLKAAQSLLTKICEGSAYMIYSHDNVFQEQEKILKYNCYGLIDYLIEKCSLNAFNELLDLMKQLDKLGFQESFDPDKPSPENFFHIFRCLHDGCLKSLYWTGIKNIANLQPGDLLVYMEVGYCGNALREKQNYATHVMLVSEIVSLCEDRIHLKVIDSAHEAHNNVDDTRHLHKFKNGLGEATLIIQESGKTVECDMNTQIYYLSWDKESNRSIERVMFAGRLRY